MNKDSQLTFQDDYTFSNSNSESDWDWADGKDFEDIDFDALETFNDPYLISKENINSLPDSCVDRIIYFFMNKIIRKCSSCSFKH